MRAERRGAPSPLDADLEGVELVVGGRPVVRDVSLHAPAGSFTGVVGPNGSGKTTLLRALYRALRPAAGHVRVGGRDVWAMPAREAARQVCVLAQHHAVEVDLTVTDVVAVGRLPHRGRFDRETLADRLAIADALCRCDVEHLADRPLTALSGGERQRVHLARALAQEAPVLVLDEPTNHLDVRSQLELLDRIRRSPVTVVAALHDLNLAAAHCDRLYVIDAGRIVAHGAPRDVLTPSLVRSVFGVRAVTLTDPELDHPVLALRPAAPAPVHPPTKEHHALPIP